MLNKIQSMQLELDALKAQGYLRSLTPTVSGLEDFSSNDYLGFSRSVSLKALFEQKLQQFPAAFFGATGSRLLSGNTDFADSLERAIAHYHHAESALFFNSGYTANLSLFATLPRKNDTIITDSCIHASIIDGCRLSYAKRLHFRHNDLDDLKRKLQRVQGTCYVVIESLYSMDGDIAPLNAINTLCKEYGALLVVDEAHAVGVYGMGLVQQEGLEQDVFARIVTYGKALGTHGASIVGSAVLTQYLINNARPFIFTTAAPFHQLLAVQCAYEHLLAQSQLATVLAQKITVFKNLMPQSYLSNPGPIQLIQVPSNDAVLKAAKRLCELGLDVRAIRSPTVPVGKERLRICLHYFNSDLAIEQLSRELYPFIQQG
jgi:8-amino-7-oxononanoate synthase